MAVDGGQIEDGAGLAHVRHPLRDRLGHGEHRADIEVEQHVHGGVLHFQERLADIGAGIVEQRVERPFRRHQRADRRAVGHVQRAGLGGEAGGGEFSHRRLHLRKAPRRQHHLGPGGGQRHGAGAADPLAGPRDQGALAIEAEGRRDRQAHGALCSAWQIKGGLLRRFV